MNLKSSIVLLITIVLLASNVVFGQSHIPFTKAYFPDDKEGLKEAQKNIDKGDEFFFLGEFSYKDAAPLYEKAYAFNPNNAELNMKLGIVYLYSPKKQRSLKFFEQSYNAMPDLDEYFHYLLGRAYHLNYKWDEAIEHYDQHLDYLTSLALEDEYSQIHRYIEECHNGRELTENPVRVWVDNLGENINSTSGEYAPLISTDESIMFVTSRRSTTVGGGKDSYDNVYYEDIYFSENIDGEWTPLKNVGDVVNGPGHDATAGISPDGRTLFVFNGEGEGGGDIFVSKMVDGTWTRPISLGSNINSEYHESTACLSYDNKELFFISDRPHGKGGRDIWYSTWDFENDEWATPVNLGSTINSPMNEDGVFFHPDGKTLYFSSKGHKGMGGNDIYMSVRDTSGLWSKPKNIGYPINTPDDDVFFQVAGDGRHAYYSSFKPDGYGEKDIYRITFLGEEKEPVLSTEDELIYTSDIVTDQEVEEQELENRSAELAILKGTVTDANTLNAIDARIEIIDNATGEQVATFYADSKTGKFLVSLPSGKDYGIRMVKDGYLFHSENINLPEAATFVQYEKDIILQKAEVGASIVLKNIFFEYNSFELTASSKIELQSLVEIMENNQNLKIEVSGHTDDVGSAGYNQSLSEKRAKAVVGVLVDELNMDSSRLSYKGFGESNPIANNKTEQGRKDNRRTEFMIVAD